MSIWSAVLEILILNQNIYQRKEISEIRHFAQQTLRDGWNQKKNWQCPHIPTYDLNPVRGYIEQFLNIAHSNLKLIVSVTYYPSGHIAHILPIFIDLECLSGSKMVNRILMFLGIFLFFYLGYRNARWDAL